MESQKFKSSLIFHATREEIMEMARKDHEWKMDGLAKNILAMPTKLSRRAFLDGFEARHGQELTDDLKRKILAIKARSAGHP